MLNLWKKINGLLETDFVNTFISTIKSYENVIAILSIILIVFLIFIEDKLVDRVKKKKLGKLLGLIGLIALAVLLFIELNFDIFKGALNLITVLAVIYLLDWIYNTLKKEIRLGIECMNIPKNIEERGFTKDFIIKEIKSAITNKLENRKIKELALSDLIDENFGNHLDAYLKEISSTKISEIKNVNILGIQFPILRKKVISNLEIRFGEDNDHLHIIAILDGKQMSNIVIRDSKNDFYDKFTEWVDEFSELIFLELLPPCLRSYYIFKIYKEEVILEIDEIIKNNKCYSIKDIITYAKNENRKKILELINQNKIELNKKLALRVYLDKKTKKITKKVEITLDKLIKNKDISKLLEVNEELKFINQSENNYYKDLKHKIILSNFLNSLKVDCTKRYCKNFKGGSKEVKEYNIRFCGKYSCALKINDTLKAYLAGVRVYNNLYRRRSYDKSGLEIKKLTEEIKLKTKNYYPPKIIKYFKDIKIETWKVKNPFKNEFVIYLYEAFVCLKEWANYRYKKEGILNTLKNIEPGLGGAHQKSLVQVMLGNWNEADKILKRYDGENSIVFQLYETKSDVSYRLKNYKKCIDAAHSCIDIELKQMYFYLSYKLCSYYQLCKENKKENYKEMLKEYLKNSKDIIEEGYKEKYGERSKWLKLKLNYLLIDFDIGFDIFKKTKDEKDKIKKLNEEVKGFLKNFVMNQDYKKKGKLLKKYLLLKTENESIDKIYKLRKINGFKLSRAKRYIFRSLKEYINVDLKLGEDLFQDDLAYLLYNLGIIYYYNEEFSKAKKYFLFIKKIERDPRTKNDNVKLKDCDLYLKSCVNSPFRKRKEKLIDDLFKNKKFKKGENIDFYFSACLKLGIKNMDLKCDKWELVVADHNYEFTD